MGKEIEFKIPVTREEAENIINKIFKKYDYSAKLKTDEYWKTYNESMLYKTVRIRSTTIFEQNSIKKHSRNIKLDIIKNWFFKNIGIDDICDSKSENTYITFKQRVVTPSGENNIEDEEEISPEQHKIIAKCFNTLGIKYFEKNKRCLTFKPEIRDTVLDALGEVVVDFDNVEDMYYFEIEYVMHVEDSNLLTQEEIIECLETIVKKFGLDPTKKDNRTWIEIINEHKKKRG